MSKKISFPKVVLVGRTNVGKSAIFNRLSSEKRSIVFGREGVTRDYLQEVITWNDKKFDLVDTGGFSFKNKRQDPFFEVVQEKVEALINASSLLLFVCDGKSGLVEEERRIARILHKTKKQVFLLINKIDNKEASDYNYAEFYSLGFDKIFLISAVHGVGIGDLLDDIVLTVDEKEIVSEKFDYKVVLLGRPNVGKSSLMNLLTKSERSIVSSVPGTTRESISEKINFQTDLVEIVDTAGIRRRKSINDNLESLMVKNSFSSIRDTDVVILIVDASEGKLCRQELKLLFYAYERGKRVLIVFNKVDLLDEQSKELLKYDLKWHDFILKKIPQIWISCKDKTGIEKIGKAIQKIWEKGCRKFDGEKLEDVVKSSLSTRPIYKNNIHLRLLKIRQVDAKSPVFVLHVNYPELFEENHIGFVENVLRENYDLRGCSIQFVIKPA